MMDFEVQDEPEPQAELGSGPSYDDDDSRPNSKLPSPPPPPLPRKPRYKECLKNHAVGIGGHAVDGCCEFMPAGEEGSLESLKCAACNCHRNFHRRDNGGSGSPFPGGLLLTHHPHGPHFGYRSPTGYLQVARPPPPLALPSSSGGDEMDDYYSNNPSSSAGKKRFRTKFTQEQKERMLNLAARLDWKIQKQDEELVQQMCSEIGVKRHVFKVWMHNNKQTLGKVRNPD